MLDPPREWAFCTRDPSLHWKHKQNQKTHLPGFRGALLFKETWWVSSFKRDEKKKKKDAQSGASSESQCTFLRAVIMAGAVRNQTGNWAPEVSQELIAYVLQAVWESEMQPHHCCAVSRQLTAAGPGALWKLPLIVFCLHVTNLSPSPTVVFKLRVTKS